MPPPRIPELTDECLLSPNRLLTINQAAGYLAISCASVDHMVKNGALPYVDVRERRPDGKYSNASVRLRIMDLDGMIMRRRKQRRRWDEDSPTIPARVVSRLLGLAKDSIGNLLASGALDDCTPDQVREKIETAYHRKFFKQLIAESMTKLRLVGGRCPVCKKVKRLNEKRGGIQSRARREKE